ncbi:hypothetical protein NDU88_002981 [Pleurodeles waltl]|uniref:Uncharacterized protein n=1 Tax=Pleurodeles waltl TaxID=8319 RepID=A0AAV7P8N7_PLEWA|nr:hypothetical protein NDU88_002981 [Pleurodeles waltl]
MSNCRLSTEGGRVGSHKQELAKTAPQKSGPERRLRPVSDTPGGTKDTEKRCPHLPQCRDNPTPGAGKATGGQRPGPASVSPGGTKDAEKCSRLHQCKGRARPRGTWMPIDSQSSHAGLKGIN